MTVRHLSIGEAAADEGRAKLQPMKAVEASWYAQLIYVISRVW